MWTPGCKVLNLKGKLREMEKNVMAWEGQRVLQGMMPRAGGYSQVSLPASPARSAGRGSRGGC